VARPLIRWSLRIREARLEGKVRALLDEVRRCQTRVDLERLLGPPQYALAGCGFRAGAVSPDSVESYAKNGCRIEVLFREGRLWAVTGSADYSAWMIAEVG
jgi:hypothetical protein